MPLPLLIKHGDISLHPLQAMGNWGYSTGTEPDSYKPPNYEPPAVFTVT